MEASETSFRFLDILFELKNVWVIKQIYTLQRFGLVLVTLKYLIIFSSVFLFYMFSIQTIFKYLFISNKSAFVRYTRHSPRWPRFVPKCSLNDTQDVSVEVYCARLAFSGTNHVYTTRRFVSVSKLSINNSFTLCHRNDWQVAKNSFHHCWFHLSQRQTTTAHNLKDQQHTFESISSVVALNSFWIAPSVVFSPKVAFLLRASELTSE